MTDQTADASAVLLVLPERADAEELAETLAERGYAPCTVHRDMLAGEDDAEDVDWVIEVRTAPHGRTATAEAEALAALAEERDGFAHTE